MVVYDQWVCLLVMVKNMEALKGKAKINLKVILYFLL